MFQEDGHQIGEVTRHVSVAKIQGHKSSVEYKERRELYKIKLKIKSVGMGSSTCSL